MVKFSVEMKPGITFANANTPIALGPMKRFATNRSNQLVKRFPNKEIVFQMPEDTSVLIEDHEK